jgi:hypothetical protein
LVAGFNLSCCQTELITIYGYYLSLLQQLGLQ